MNVSLVLITFDSNGAVVTTTLLVGDYLLVMDRLQPILIHAFMQGAVRFNLDFKL